MEVLSSLFFISMHFIFICLWHLSAIWTWTFETVFCAIWVPTFKQYVKSQLKMQSWSANQENGKSQSGRERKIEKQELNEIDRLIDTNKIMLLTHGRCLFCYNQPNIHIHIERERKIDTERESKIKNVQVTCISKAINGNDCQAKNTFYTSFAILSDRIWECLSVLVFWIFCVQKCTSFTNE